MQPLDFVKQLYQACYGAEHLLIDIPAARRYFLQEMDSVPPDDVPLFERISPDYGRVNLSAWKENHLPPEWLFRMFVLTASRKNASVPPVFSPVHHSSVYREKEHPSYRVVCSRILRLIPLLLKINALPQKKAPAVIAIDGRSASGKTTAALFLDFILNHTEDADDADGTRGVIHMDDFFLPEQLRTTERLAEPGGNVDYDRFLSEVLPRIRGEEFSYRTFDCSEMKFGKPQAVENVPFRITEGAYSHHPRFGSYADISVFSDIDPAEQETRILRRNGPARAEDFKTKWIPLEETYFREFRIKENADIVI